MGRWLDPHGSRGMALELLTLSLQFYHRLATDQVHRPGSHIPMPGKSSGCGGAHAGSQEHILSDPHTCMASLLRVPSNKQVKYSRFRLMSQFTFFQHSHHHQADSPRDFNLTSFPLPTRQSSRRNLERIQSRCLSISTTTFWPSAPSSRPSMPGTLVS